MKKIFILVAAILALAIHSGCIGEKDMLKTREAFAKKTAGKITVGIPGPMSLMKDSTGFLNGVNMAVDEVNAKNGGDGKFIDIRVEDDKATFMDGIKIAQNFTSQPEIAAVIGHWNSSITIPAAKVYNDAGVIMLSPVVSNTDLTRKGYGYVFRNTVSDYEMGRQMAKYAMNMNYKRIIVYYADNEYGRGLANAFEDTSKQNGITVIDRVTDFASAADFNKALDKWRAFNYDAVFVADSMPHAAEFIQQIRQVDSKVPMFGGDGLDMADFPDKLGKLAEGFVVATMFNPQDARMEQKEFISKYRQKYASEPDVWAIQGYDSIKLLAYAVEKAGSTSPAKIAGVLHGLKDWKGVLGTISFDATGEMTGKEVYKKIVRNGQFIYLPN